MDVASFDDIRQFIAKCEQDPSLQVAGNIVRVIANTGLHSEDLKSLRITDINPDGQYLEVTHTGNRSVEELTLPIFERTHTALHDLHAMNPSSSLLLGDSPRVRVDSTVSILKAIAPEFAREGRWLQSIRKSFELRLYSANIPARVVRYMLGQQSLAEAFSRSPHLSRVQMLQICRRALEHFVPEL
ncbi:MAG: site-specific integrase [Acidobacteriaceae bacterium]|nr:site-specific integrase [Acidobacteriaceae bacterium]